MSIDITKILAGGVGWIIVKYNWSRILSLSGPIHQRTTQSSRLEDDNWQIPQQNTPMADTLAVYLDNWLKKAASGGLRNPLLKMPVKGFRLLNADESAALQSGKPISIGTQSETISRRLWQKYKERIRERGEHTAFLTKGSAEVTLDGETGSGGKRIALMPIWLQRIELQNLNDQIRAVPYEQPVWDLNPEMGTILDPLGIDLRDGPLGDPESHIRWLGAQLMNRGVVNASASFVGCFSSQHLVIRERIADTRWRRSLAKNHAILAKIEGPIVAENDHATSTSDEGIEDQGLILPIDDSQLRVVQLATAGRSMIVQGPPGTGKSQTIANLISSFLWQGKRALLVCDKRTAILQVEERLQKCMLGPALLNLHDEGLDKRAFLQQAVEQFKNDGSALLFPFDQLAELRQALNQRVIEGSKIVHSSLGIQRHQAVAGMIRLRRELKNSTPKLEIPNWQSLSRDRVTRLLGTLNEWKSLKPVVTDSSPTWNAIAWQSFQADPNAQFEISGLVKDLRDQIDRVAAIWELAAVAGCEQTPESPSAIGDLYTLAKLIVDRPPCFAAIMDDLTLNATHLLDLRRSFERRAALLARPHPCDISHGPDQAVRPMVEVVIAAEKVAVWRELDDNRTSYRGRLNALLIADSNYKAIVRRRGMCPLERIVARQAQLAQVRSLHQLGVRIPPSWWDQIAGTPAAEILRWKSEFRSLATHVGASAYPMDLAALERVSDLTWKGIESAIEDGFNFVSYALRFRNDRRMKVALKQIYPSIPRKLSDWWEEAAVHAFKAHLILQTVRAAAKWHSLLDGWTSSFCAESLRATSFPEGAGVEQITRLRDAAIAVETMRQRNDWFSVESPVWTTYWQSLGIREHSEIEANLAEWQATGLPAESSDALSDNQAWYEQRIQRISEVLELGGEKSVLATIGILDAWHDRAEYLRLCNHLKELERYTAIPESQEPVPNWDNAFRILEWRDKVRLLRGRQRLDLSNSAWPIISRSTVEWVTCFTTGLENFSRFFPSVSKEANDFDLILQKLSEIDRGRAYLDVWLRKAEWTDKVRAWPELAPFWKHVTEGSTPIEAVHPLFCYNLLRSCEPQVDPSGTELAESLKLFASQDEQLEQWSVQRLIERLRRGQAESRADHLKESASLLHLASLQKPQGTIREICQKHLRYLLGQKRTWLMSPISLANLFDPQFLEDHGTPFDVVIFDEASQIQIAEGLLALGFAKQTIIVGDDKQLPPTSFFAAGAPDGQHDGNLGESESLIEEFNGVLVSAMLMAHYRSETPDLISFSNHKFYRGKLEMYPPARVSGIGRRLRLVPDGIFDSGGTRTNLPEAKVIVDLVKEHVDTSPGKSLGVVTMNEAQMEVIDSLLLNASQRVRDFCGDDSKFFIRNLETVQGDEMDRIIVGLTYARTADGRFNAAILGPLTKKGGQRRLNVALSRSRSGMTIVTSLTSKDLAESEATSDGFKCLRELLEELESAQDRKDYGITNKRFAKKPDGLSETIYCESPFEEEVVEYLENQGLDLRCQVGAGEFRIDIVILERGYPLLAVECDGAAYHRSRSARTRDRARQRHLERLGWKFHRVWSTNWWRTPDSEKQALDAAISIARNEFRLERPGPALGASHSVVAIPLVRGHGPLTTTASDTLGPSIAATQQSETNEATVVSRASVQLPASAPRDPSVHDLSTAAPAKPVVSSAPANLAEFAMRTDWPQCVVGKRIIWRGDRGIFTQFEDGRYLYFRKDGESRETMFSADVVKDKATSANKSRS